MLEVHGAIPVRYTTLASIVSSQIQRLNGFHVKFFALYTLKNPICCSQLR